MEITVKELIKKLSEYPENLRVLVEGYEGGFSDILKLRQIHVLWNEHKEDWLGPHEETSDSKEIAVVILRSPNLNADEWSAFQSPTKEGDA